MVSVIFRSAQRRQKLWRFSQLRLEATDAEPGQIRLQAIDDAGALTDQVFPFTAGPLGVLFLDRRDRDHSAIAPFAAQPSQEHPHQHGSIEPIGLGPSVLARDRDAAGMDDMSLNSVPGEPPAPARNRLVRLRTQQRCV